MFKEIIIPLFINEVDAFSDRLLALGAISVMIEDAKANTPDEKPIFGEPGIEVIEAAWPASRLIILVDSNTDPQQLLTKAANSLNVDIPMSELTVRDVPKEDWVTLTQAQFEPISVGQHIWVVPSWHQPPNSEALILKLDPGLAFGTGSHPTTHLCMEWLELKVKPYHRVLDYGCGSGILAILAAKLGATDVVGIDIDPQAIETARFNCAQNNVTTTLYLADESNVDIKQGFDIVVANILSNPLKVLAPLLSSRVVSGGWLGLSGILSDQAQDVIEMYASYISLTVWRENSGWVCLAGQKK